MSVRIVTKMPLDIQLFREKADEVRENQRRRFKDENLVDKFLELDGEWLNIGHSIGQKRAELNLLKKEIGLKKRAKEECDDLLQRKKMLDRQIAKLEAGFRIVTGERDALWASFGNIVHHTVPISNDEETGNLIVSEWGEKRVEPNLRFHHELLYMIDGVDYDRGAAVSGHRGYFLKGVGVQLNYALINYAMEFLQREQTNYTLLQTPFMMKKDVMAKTAQLEQFDEELYKVQVDPHAPHREKYLIATSEQPISAFHMNEWLEPTNLPLRYAGVSTCFRKEAGKTGKDVWGIFRVHQFEKVEQFCITTPDESWDEHEKMLRLAEEFHQSLGLPYRVVVIVSGELNNAASKKYDLEAWFPGNTQSVGNDNHTVEASYRELVSCSNCTDYQSRALNIRYRGGSDKQYVHMLNSTLTATGRVICAILENHQTEDGINIPEPLQKYMGDRKFIPFVHNQLPKRKGAKA